MKSEINYDPTLAKKAGGVLIDPDDLRPQDGKTLLTLLFTILYTKKGRQVLTDNAPDDQTGQLPSDKRQTLVDYCNSFGVTSPDVQNAIIDAHVAGHMWTVAYNQGQPGDATRLSFEKVYLQKVSFIMWSIWEDAKGHEFSMAW